MHDEVHRIDARVRISYCSRGILQTRDEECLAPRPVLVRTGGLGGAYEWCQGYDDVNGDGQIDFSEVKRDSLEKLVQERSNQFPGGPGAWDEWESFPDRIREMGCARSGDIVLIFDMKYGLKQTVSGDPDVGQHGSPSPEESIVPLAFAFRPLGDPELVEENQFVVDAVKDVVDEPTAPRRVSHMAEIIKQIFVRARGKPPGP